jgi:hypothetical protein
MSSSTSFLPQDLALNEKNVAKVFNKASAIVQCVYVSLQSNLHNQTKLVLQKGLKSITTKVFISSNPNLSKDEIEMNSAQREFLEIELGERIQWRSLTPKEELASMIPLKKIVLGCAWSRRSCKEKIQENDVIEKFQNRFLNQIVNLDFSTPFESSEFSESSQDYKNNRLNIEIAHIEADVVKSNKEEKQKVPTRFGLLTKTTEIVVLGEIVAVNRLLKVKDISFRNSGVGGLDDALEELFRRILLTRAIPKAVFERYGLTHVKGVLLYGAPGCGKYCQQVYFNERTIRFLRGLTIFIYCLVLIFKDEYCTRFGEHDQLQIQSDQWS